MLSLIYLSFFARDQYASRVSFSVRSAETTPALEFLGGVSQLGGADSLDSEILADFVHSQTLVEELDRQLNLSVLYGCPSGIFDFLYCLKRDATIEELVSYWNRIVSVTYDGGAGILEIEVRAFDPKTARLIATELFDLSSKMINELTSSARDDATRYARVELAQAVDRLKEARSNLAKFRSTTQIIDPEADLSGQMGVISNLQEQLTQALIDRGMIEMTTARPDPRIDQLDRKIEVIERQILLQRQKFGNSAENGGNNYAKLIGQFEELSVEVEFAEKSYLQALSGLDAAIAEAAHRSRYLTAHVKPTLAEGPEYPRKIRDIGLVLFFSLFIWLIGVLIYYSLRDRR